MSDRYHDHTERFDDRDRDRRDDRPDRRIDRRYDQDRYDDRRFDRDDRRPRRPVATGTLPDFLKARILRDGEKVESVRGPRSNPFWEAYLTHPAGIGVGVALAVVAVAATWLVSGGEPAPMGGAMMFALVSSVGSLALVGIMAGIFTRLVVTNRRVLIVQGYEIRKSWRVEDLPRSMVRLTRGDDGEMSRTVDMEKLQTMMGGESSGGFAEAKTIWALSKEIDRAKREDRPGDDRRDDRP